MVPIDFYNEIEKVCQSLRNIHKVEWHYSARLVQNGKLLWAIIWPEPWKVNGLFELVDNTQTPMLYFEITLDYSSNNSQSISIMIIADVFLKEKVEKLKELLNSIKLKYQTSNDNVHEILFDNIVEKMENEDSFVTIVEQKIQINQKEIIEFVNTYYNELNPFLS